MQQQLQENVLQALRRVTNYAARQTCAHDDTYRGGVLWEICSNCGMKWADDEGGRPEDTDPPELVEAAEAIAALEAALASDSRVRITSDGAAAVDPDYYWRDIDENTPRGVKLQLLTDTGIALHGHWQPYDRDIVGWAPLPKKRKKVP